MARGDHSLKRSAAAVAARPRRTRQRDPRRGIDFRARGHHRWLHGFEDGGQAGHLGNLRFADAAFSISAELHDL